MTRNLSDITDFVTKILRAPRAFPTGTAQDDRFVYFLFRKLISLFKTEKVVDSITNNLYN